MITTETNNAFPLSSVKPLDGILSYRQYCLDLVKNALQSGSTKRDISPVSGKKLIPAGHIDGLAYGECPDTHSYFLSEMPAAAAWSKILAEVNQKRQSPNGFHTAVVGSRIENVYLPKLDWVQNFLRIEEMSKPSLLEVITPPSRFTSLLKLSGSFQNVTSVDEMELANGRAGAAGSAQAAVLLESLDRVNEPAALLSAVHKQLSKNGLVFVTALVASGFDMQVLGFNNLYFYPPDRANCFTLKGLGALLEKQGFKLLEISSPGVLDVEIVQAHARRNPELKFSKFESSLVSAEGDAKQALQNFLQQAGLSSFARIVGRKV